LGTTVILGGGGRFSEAKYPFTETTHLGKICAVQEYLAHKKLPPPQVFKSEVLQ